ncbi:MAG: hypothetical protein NTY09_01920 [bacterium]|nr:hypothetical protein [bacterium]
MTVRIFPVSMQEFSVHHPLPGYFQYQAGDKSAMSSGDDSGNINLDSLKTGDCKETTLFFPDLRYGGIFRYHPVKRLIQPILLYSIKHPIFICQESDIILIIAVRGSGGRNPV